MWTHNYLFILPTRINAVPLCLLCKETVSTMKEYNVSCHYNTKHKATFEELYPLQSQSCVSKIASLKLSYKKETRILIQKVTQQERATAASLRVTWQLTKNMRPFTDAETVKTCMMVALNEIIVDPKVKGSIIPVVQQIPMSDTTTSRRIEILDSEILDSILQGVARAEKISIAIDESTDKTDIAQFTVFVHYFDETCF